MAWLAGYGKDRNEENDNLGVDWVLKYEFGDIGNSRLTLLASAEDTNFQFQTKQKPSQHIACLSMI